MEDALLSNHTGPTDYDEGSWPAMYFLIAYGSTSYGVTFAAFPILQHYARTELWTPLKVKQIGLTQLSVLGAFLYTVHRVLLTLLPTDVSNDILPPHQVSCWLADLWKITAIFFYTNCILIKEYRSYLRYVAREPLPQTLIHVLISAIPYSLLLVLPLSRYDSDSDKCNTTSAVTYPLFALMVVVFLISAFLTNTLRDTVTFFPNLRSAIGEVSGLLIVVLANGVEIFAPGSQFTREYIATFVLCTVPPLAFWYTLGRTLMKLYSGDLTYCRNLERLCSPTSHLISANRESILDDDSAGVTEDKPRIFCYATASPVIRIANPARAPDDSNMGSVVGASSSYISVGAGGVSAGVGMGGVPYVPRMRPNYAKGDRGEFFETDRLASLIDSGDHEEVKRYVLETNLDLVHVLDRDGLAPLHRAVQGGCDDLVAFLLEINCDPNIPAKDGDRAIHFAARLGDVVIIELLADANADVNAVSHRGVTPLGYAVLSRSLSAITLLLERGALASIPDEEGCSGDWEKVHIHDAGRLKNYWKRPLTLAVEIGHQQIVHEIASRIEPNTSCIHGFTPLMLAVAMGHKGVVQELLDSGADIWRITSRQKRSVLHYNAMHGSRSMFDTLKESFLCTQPPTSPPSSPEKSTIPKTPVVSATDAEGDVECSSHISPAFDDDVEESGSGSGSAGSDDVDDTPSDVAALVETSTPQLLWTGPADPKQLLAVFLSMPDSTGRTPLHYAVLRRHLDLAAMLAAQGSNPNVRDVRLPDKGYTGSTPAEYIQQCLHNNELLSSAERSRYQKLWKALQQSQGPIGERI